MKSRHLLAALLLLPLAGFGQNILQNPDFDTDVTGWLFNSLPLPVF